MSKYVGIISILSQKEGFCWNFIFFYGLAYLVGCFRQECVEHSGYRIYAYHEFRNYLLRLIRIFLHELERLGFLDMFVTFGNLFPNNVSCLLNFKLIEFVEIFLRNS